MTTRNIKKRKSTSQKAPEEFGKKVETLGEISSIDGSLWRLCLHPLEYRRDLNPDLTDLVERASSNPFFNPAFLAASRDRVTRNRIYQIILWEVQDTVAIARLAFPVSHHAKTLFLPEFFQSLTHPYAPFGDPIIHDQDIEVTLSRFAELLKLAFNNDFPALVMDYVSANSKLNQFTRYNHSNIGHTAIKLGARASINQKLIPHNDQLISKKRKRELNRLLKKLKEHGDVSFEMVRQPIDVILRFEEFLLLETQTWKGKHGTSINTIKRDAAFARQSANDLAKEGKCEIFSMRLNDKPLASLILFKSGGYYFPWKIAFNTRFSHLSPGTQLMLRLSEDIASRDDFKFADSLTKFGHSWMSGQWPDETSFSKFIFAKDEKEVSFIANRLNLAMKTKSLIKKLLRK